MGNTKVEHATFVGKLVGKNGKVPNTKCLRGYPGASKEKKHFRLYLSADLSSYYEVPEKAVLHVVNVAESDRLGAQDLWVKADAALRLVSSKKPKGAWLNGGIAGGGNGGVGGPGAHQNNPSTQHMGDTCDLYCDPALASDSSNAGEPVCSCCESD